jgi:predicted transcriptional regulator
LPCSEDILISVRPEYFAKILRGEKTIELRRRPVRVSVGTTVWIYETVPKGRLGARAQISAIFESTPTEVWTRFGHCVGLTKEQFFAYFKDAVYACALLLKRVVAFDKPLRLPYLRKELGAFVAPQFYRKLQSNGREVNLFRALLAEP